MPKWATIRSTAVFMAFTKPSTQGQTEENILLFNVSNQIKLQLIVHKHTLCLVLMQFRGSDGNCQYVRWVESKRGLVWLTWGPSGNNIKRHRFLVTRAYVTFTADSYAVCMRCNKTIINLRAKGLTAKIRIILTTSSFKDELADWGYYIAVCMTIWRL